MASFKNTYTQIFTTCGIKAPGPLRVAALLVLGALVILLSLMCFTPWVQTAYGTGLVTNFNPSHRPQNISAPVKGRIKEWLVHEGSVVKKDDILLEITDNDPDYLNRLDLELKSVEQKVNAARIAAETSLLDYQRKQDLHARGLASRRELEKAKIEYNQYLEKEAAAVAYLAKVQADRARQNAQVIRAPSDGVIVQMRGSNTATFVKEGDFLASFIPLEAVPAIELYVKGNDAPLINPGAKVRIQFEGWPAIQFSGWPSVSVGTFGGIVQSIDPAASTGGKFRVLITQDPQEKWPSRTFLRYGAKAQGWVLLNTVSLGYEWWRQLNGFPPEPSEDTSPYALESKYYGDPGAGNEK